MSAGNEDSGTKDDIRESKPKERRTRRRKRSSFTVRKRARKSKSIVEEDAAEKCNERAFALLAGELPREKTERVDKAKKRHKSATKEEKARALDTNEEEEKDESVRFPDKSTVKGMVARAVYYGRRRDTLNENKWLRKASDAKDAWAAIKLGVRLEHVEQTRNEPDFSVVARLYRIAAEQGDARGQLYLSALYENGQGVPKDEKQYAFWLRKAAEGGDTEGMYLFGAALINGSTADIGMDYPKGVEYLTKAAEKGEDRAQSCLGDAYIDGQYGVDKHVQKGIDWLKKSVDQNNRYAMTSLGLCYELGKCVPKSLEKAIELYQKASDLGNIRAKCFLGMSYRDGVGVEQDDDMALRLLLSAAEKGDSLAQYSVGLAYYQAQCGLRKNMAYVRMYLERAANNPIDPDQDAERLLRSPAFSDDVG